MENTFTIRSNGDYLEIVVLNYAYLNSNDTYDKNWLHVVINIKAGAFTGKFKAFFQTTDFVDLWHQLNDLYNSLGQRFKFSTLEDQLAMDFTGDGSGHINVDARAQDQAGNGNSLNFELNIDQADVKELMNQLNNISKQYPVK